MQQIQYILTKERAKCVIITDSNGREATEDSIKRHILHDQRDNYEIKIEVAYTLQEAYDRLDRRQIDVRGATVYIDNLTNDVRGSRLNAAATPDELVYRLSRLRRGVLAAGAVAVVTCAIKPMQIVDVTPYNALVDEHLRSQIRLEHLKHDGFHVKPQFDSVIDRGYACAILGIYVPNPTGWKDFVPDSIKRRREKDWPKLPQRASAVGMGWWGEGMTANVHGWR